jgi:hypothetical protein
MAPRAVHASFVRGLARGPLVLAVLLALSACAATRPPEIVAARGQAADQLDRDRFECALQAQWQTEFDPGADLARGLLVGALVGGALGAGAGAIGGAIGSGVEDSAIVGTIMGGGVGMAVGGQAGLAHGVEARERALRACLEARGYLVRERSAR